MKNLRRLCAAAVLTIALSLSTFAGQMEFPVSDPPPPPPAPSPVDTDGQMEFPVNCADPVTEAVLTLIQSVLPLF